MILNWIFRFIIPHWDVLIENPATGKASSKNLFTVLGFYVAIVLTVCITVARIREGKDPDWTVILPLTIQALGLTSAKIVQGYLNRKTATDTGQPLAEPGTNPPVPMPQPYNPNAPVGPVE
ncbi:hypothetical protein GCM10027048_27590 [Hymenobacter coalescens]